MSSSESLKTVVTEASKSIDEEEMHFMLQHSYSLANLFASVENLQYCVTLATARRDRPGFPLVYVNKAFEAATGYKREEIIGQNCSFLQSESTEQDQIDLMVQALATAQPVKVVLTNKRKDGTGSIFDKNLALSPYVHAILL
jgi:PAS domain-containing protein